MKITPVIKNFKDEYKLLRFQDENKNLLDLDLFKCIPILINNNIDFNEEDSDEEDDAGSQSDEESDDEDEEGM